MSREEPDRLAAFYREHLDRPGVRRRWDLANPGNARAFAELSAATAGLVPGPLAGTRLLDLGCGSGDVLAWWVARGVSPSAAVGVDLLDFRLRDARARHPGLAFVRASGAALPLASGSVDLVLAYTMFSSVLDPAVARGIAAEVDRVLVPGGRVVWYDFRVRRPGSTGTRGIRLREVRAAFPGYAVTARTLTLLPPLARALGPLTRVLYGPLSAVPALRTHRLAVLEKSERPG